MLAVTAFATQGYGLGWQKQRQLSASSCMRRTLAEIVISEYSLKKNSYRLFKLMMLDGSTFSKQITSPNP